MSHPGDLELMVLLAVLRLEESAYGVTIREELERETSRTIAFGTVYKTLGRMEGKGFLRSRMAEPTGERGGRRKKLYEITPAGLAIARRSVADLRRLTRGLEAALEGEAS
jgi:DNA-binding PadR family transcriptional regulator